MNQVLIQVSDLTIGYEGQTLYEGLCFDICSGDCIMLCGANGSGKTTLLRSLAERYENTIMVPARIPKIPGFTTSEFVRISCYTLSGNDGRLSANDLNTLYEALDKLGIRHLEDRDISTLSDGEFQKAAIAAALVRKAQVILLDEPTAFLDAENRIAVLQSLRRLCIDNDTPAAVIFSTHDLHDGMEAATKVIALGADGVMRISSECKEDIIRTIFRNS